MKIILTDDNILLCFREDIDTLRNEMRNVHDIVLDLRNSLTSPPDKTQQWSGTNDGSLLRTHDTSLQSRRCVMIIVGWT